MIENSERLALVNELLQAKRPLDEIKTRLSAFEWDYDGPCIELTKKHLLDALGKYLSDDLGGDEIEIWANLVEGREDICTDPNTKPLIEQVLYELANPALTQPLTEHRAKALLTTLL